MSAPMESVAVVRIANHFVAVHQQEDQSKFLSNFEPDVEIAAKIALTFAKNHHVPFFPKIAELNQPIMTIIKQANGNWCPAKLHSDRVQLITGFDIPNGKDCLEGNQEHASNIAQSFAKLEELDFLPQIGISIASKVKVKNQ